MLNALTSGVKTFFANEFGRKEARDFLDGSATDNGAIIRDTVDIKRIGTLAGAGAAGGAVIGAAVGGAMAAHAISKVPMQSVTVPFSAPSLHSEELGKIPQNDYVPTPDWTNGMSMRWGYPSTDNGVPTVPVLRDNPSYQTTGAPRLVPTQETFTGRGTPTTSWETRNIQHHNMQGYQRTVTPHTESVYDHTEHWTEQEPHTVYDTQQTTSQDCTSQYNSDGSTGQDCHTVYGTEQVARTEYRTVDRSRDVYRDELRGFFERYSPNVVSRVVGTYQAPQVSFDHGIDTAGYVLKGMLIGAGIGAIALGVAGALEDKYFPGVLPGYKAKDKSAPTPPVGPSPLPAPRPTPSPKPVPPRGKPTKPVPPAPFFGEVETHAHEGQRHTHAGGDRWHFHGCLPGEKNHALDTHKICFKPDQVPSGYLAEQAVPCDSNGSVCYIEKGVGAA